MLNLVQLKTVSCAEKTVFVFQRRINVWPTKNIVWSRRNNILRPVEDNIFDAENKMSLVYERNCAFLKKYAMFGSGKITFGSGIWA